MLLSAERISTARADWTTVPVLVTLSSNVLPSDARPDTRRSPPPNTGSCEMTKLPTTRLTPTKLAGQGRSNTVPRHASDELVLNTSDTTIHSERDAHHAHSGAAAHPSQLRNSSHCGFFGHILGVGIVGSCLISIPLNSTIS